MALLKSLLLVILPAWFRERVFPGSAMIARHRRRMLRFALTLAPIAGASPDGDDDDDEDKDKSGDATPGDDEEDEDGDEVEDDKDDKASTRKAETDWKRMARKHERRAKQQQKELDDLKAQLAARADQDKSEQEKAIEQAQQQAVKDLEEKHARERRQDRLEVASTKLAATGIKVGSGDDAKTIKFADPDDALVYLERDIRAGDLDADDLFDDQGRVKEDALKEALGDLLERKPHLAAEAKTKKVKGSADAGKGAGADTGDTSVEDQLKKIRRHRPDQAPSYVVTRRQ